MSETRKLAAILVADVVGYSRLASADEERTLARLRGLRSDLIDPAIAANSGRRVHARQSLAVLFCAGWAQWPSLAESAGEFTWLRRAATRWMLCGRTMGPSPFSPWE